MPVRISKYWRPALRAVAKIQLENSYPDLAFLWVTYTLNQRKAVRRMQRDLLSEKKRQQLRGLNQMMQASVELGLYDGELEGIPRRPVPVPPFQRGIPNAEIMGVLDATRAGERT